MEIERQNDVPTPRTLSTPARVALGALAIFGAVTLVQWVVGALLGIIKLALVVVVTVAVGVWIVGAKGSR